jgi:membrane protein DedA with SNARE-associated domain
VNRDAATTFVAHWGYLGVFIALLVEEAGVPLPVPGDLFIAALGAAGRADASNFVVTTAVVFVASMSGTAILFELSRRFGQPMLDRIGKRFGFSEQKARTVERWLQRYGAVAIVGGRLTPGLRILMTVGAGTLRMPRDRFMIGTAIASVIWASVYYWLGYALASGVAAVSHR